MALFGSPKPVVLKEGSAAEEQLRQMEDAKGTLSPRAEARLEKDLRLVRAGIDGERHILYELKNSHMDMFILQDLFLEHEGLTAQIDFLVITPQRNFVIECKNLVGNIEINSRGDFIRTFEGGKKEGIYSPVTQNHRHLELIKALRKAGRSTVANLVAGSSTDDAYRSLVVLANPKTILNDRYAKRDVKAQVIRADQLIETIKRINNEKRRAATRRSAPLPKIALNGSWPSTSQGRLITSLNIGKSRRPSRSPRAQNPQPRTTPIRNPWSQASPNNQPPTKSPSSARSAALPW